MKKIILTLIALVSSVGAYAQCPQVSLGEDRSACATGGNNLQAEVSGEISTLTWSTSGSGTFSRNNANTTVYYPSAADAAAGSVVISLDAEGTNECYISDQVTVTFRNGPTVNAGEDLAVCSGDSLELSGSLIPEGGSGLWTQIGNSGPDLEIYDDEDPASVVSNTTLSNQFNNQATVNLLWTVTDETGCSNTDTVAITIGRPVNADADDDIVVCPGGSDEVTLSGNNPVAGTGQWSFAAGTETNANITDPSIPNTKVTGLTSSETLNLVWTVSNTSCPADRDTMTITVVNSLIANADAGEDLTICEGETAQLAGSAVPEGAIGSWRTLGFGTPDISFSDEESPTAEISDTDLGPGNSQPSVTLIWSVEDENGCAAEDTVLLNIRRAPVADAGDDELLCLGSETALELDANTPAGSATGTWSFVAGTVTRAAFADPSDPNTTLTGITTPGELSIVWTVSNAPCEAERDTLVINAVNSMATSVSAGEDQTLCSGDTIELTGSGIPEGGEGRWSQVGTGNPDISFEDDEMPVTAVRNTSLSGNGSSQATVPLTWEITDSNGCSSADTVVLNIRRAPNADAGDDQTICAGSIPSAVLNGNISSETSSGTWSFASAAATTAVITNPNSPTTTVSGLSTPGDLRLVWTLSNAPCAADRDTVLLSITDGSITVADAGEDLTICEGTEVTLAANEVLETETGEWSRVGGSLQSLDLSDENDPAATLENTAIGGGNNSVLNLVWSISQPNGCLSTDTVALAISQTPNADAGDDQTICYGTPSILLDANGAIAGGSGTWSVAGSTSTAVFTDPGSPNSGLTNLNRQETLSLVWTITNAPCEADRDTVVITVNTPPATALVEAPVYGPDAIYSICIDDTITIVGSTPETGTASWTRIGQSNSVGFVNGGGNFNNTINNDSAMVRGITAGTVSFRYRISNGNNDAESGCVSYDTLTITVTENCNVTSTFDNSHLDNTSTFNVHPNPGQGLFYLTTANANEGPVDITVINPEGKVFYTEKTSFHANDQHAINLSELGKGLYLMRIIKDEKMEILKINIQ